MVEKDDTKKTLDTQPAPKSNNYDCIWDLVMGDMQSRDKLGLQKYKTRLQPFNGRNSVKDAYEEALDLVVYLKQLQFEKDTLLDLLKKFSKPPASLTQAEENSYEAYTMLHELGEL
jgi:hypothetical protein